MENVEARIAALELVLDRVAGLELAVRELRAELDRERTRIRTMRQTLRCPSCGHRRILHFRRINEVTDTGVLPLSLTTQYRTWWGAKAGEPLHVYVCRACGLLEWHATALDTVKVDGDAVVEIWGDDPASPSQPPYR